MGSLLMTLNLLMNEAETMLVRQYGKKKCEAGIFFNAVICLFASIFFIVTDKNIFLYPKELFPYSIISCILYAGGFYFMYLALATGSFIGSKMLSSSSVIIPVCYGILFLGENVNLITCIAIFMMFLSIFMQVYEKSESKIKNASSKWIIYALLTAICNGFITVVTRIQQIQFNSNYDNKFMFSSFFGAFVFLVFFSHIKERGKIKGFFARSITYGMGVGMLNGVKNLLNLLILLYFPISVSIPVKMVLGYILSFMISVFLYKEPFSKLKLAGIITGIFSVLLFTI